MGDDVPEVFDIDANVDHFLSTKFFEVELVDGDRTLRWLLKDLCCSLSDLAFD